MEDALLDISGFTFDHLDECTIEAHGPLNLWASFDITDTGLQVRGSNLNIESPDFAQLALAAARFSRRNPLTPEDFDVQAGIAAAASKPGGDLIW